MTRFPRNLPHDRRSGRTLASSWSRLHGRAKHFDIAVAAYEAAVRVEPRVWLKLRLGAEVLPERKTPPADQP